MKGRDNLKRYKKIQVDTKFLQMKGLLFSFLQFIVVTALPPLEKSPRNFMSTSFEGYSPDGDAIAMASTECLAAREAFRQQLQRIKRELPSC